MAEEVRVDAEADLRDDPQASRPIGPMSSDDVLDWADNESLASWNLKRIRTALGVSQQQIADRLPETYGGVRLAQTQIAKIERGERPWRVNELFAIAEALKVDWTEFFQAGGTAGDPQMVLLASRLKYQNAEQEESLARLAWRRTALEAQKAGLEMCKTAARLGIDDPEVRGFLQTRYHFLGFLKDREERQKSVVGDALLELSRESEEYADQEWKKLLAEAQKASEQDSEE